MYLLAFSALLGVYTTIDVSHADLLTTEHDTVNSYYLYFSKIRYSWESAQQQCLDTGTSMVMLPYSDTVKSMVEDWDIASDVWVTDLRNRCMSLKIQCVKTSSSLFGGQRCVQREIQPMYADCTSYKRYVLCTSVLTTTPVPTTTTTSTTTTQPTTTTVTTTTTTTTPTTTLRTATLPVVTRARPSATNRGLSTQATTGEAGTGMPIAETFNKHEGGIVGFALGLAAAKTDLLGLIIGVVTGTFLILSLVFILCCACQGQSSPKPKKYELVDRESNNSLVGGMRNVSNTSTNTLEGPYKAASTEESSLEMSDARSHSTKQSDHDICLTAYPPPPCLYDTPPNVYNILPTVNQHQTRPNPLYNIHHGLTRDRMVSEELPLPPPPPALHGITPLPESDCEETCIRGLDPTFKTFLDKTIAIKPMNSHGNMSTPGSPKRGEHEMKRLITSDL